MFRVCEGIAFPVSAFGDQNRKTIRALRMKTVSHCREQAGWTSIAVVSQVQKEIPRV